MPASMKVPSKIRESRPWGPMQSGSDFFKFFESSFRYGSPPSSLGLLGFSPELIVKESILPGSQRTSGRFTPVTFNYAYSLTEQVPMKKYTRSTIKSTKGFGSNKPYLESIEEHGRAVIGVLADDAGDPRPLDFGYSVPMPGVQEPVILTSYPSDKTTPWLLNAIGAHFREHGWDDLETDNFKLIEGQLGQHVEFPVAVRLLTEAEAAISHERYTCQADPDNPVVLLSVPDPDGQQEATSA